MRTEDRRAQADAILAADGGDGPGLAGLGLTAARAEQALAGEFARIQAQRRVSG
jgi:hypothetical protein